MDPVAVLGGENLVDDGTTLRKMSQNCMALRLGKTKHRDPVIVAGSVGLREALVGLGQRRHHRHVGDKVLLLGDRNRGHDTGYVETTPIEVRIVRSLLVESSRRRCLGQSRLLLVLVRSERFRRRLKHLFLVPERVEQTLRWWTRNARVVVDWTGLVQVRCSAAQGELVRDAAVSVIRR